MKFFLLNISNNEIIPDENFPDYDIYMYGIVENFDVFDAFQLDSQNLTRQIV